MSGTFLKTFALITMVLDHLGLVFDNQFLRSVGRVAFILFAFSCAEGWRLTKDKDRYLCRLMVWAGVSQLPYMLLKGLTPVFWLNTLAICTGVMLAVRLFGDYRDTKCLSSNTGYLVLFIGSFFLPMILYQDVLGGVPVPMEMNVLYTMFVACLGMRCIDENLKDWGANLQFLCAVLFCGIYADYSVLGIALIMFLYWSDQKGIGRQCIVAVLWSFAVYMIGMNSPQDFAGALAGSLLILIYNRDKGAGPKWYRNAFYWFYPTHMMILWYLSCAKMLC